MILSHTLVSFVFEESGDGPRVLAWLVSFLIGAGASNTWAAVGAPFGCRVGGVMEPPRTGNSSASGTRCFVTVGLLLA